MTAKKQTTVAIVFIFLIASALGLQSFYRQPLGPALELPTTTLTFPH